MKRYLTLFILLLILLAGCADTGKSPLASPQTSQTEPVQNAEKSTAIGETKIILHRSGGIAGLDETWTISGDGKATDNAGNSLNLTPEKVSAITQELEALGFFELQQDYLPLDTCCDRRLYALTVTSNGKTHTVKALEGESSTPQAFWQAVELIQKSFSAAP